MSIETKAEWWVGFACQKCGAPLALQRPNDPSKAGPLAGAGWRVTCPGCGATVYYERGTPTIKITISG